MLKAISFVPVFVLLVCSLATAPAAARDTIVYVNLSEAVAAGQASGKLDGTVAFYLAGQKAPAAAQRLGDGVSNRKTNAFNKSDTEACRWVVESALIAFQKGAKARGADAVIDLVSYYRKRIYSDPNRIECHAGGLMAGVALKGEYAKLDGH